MEVGIWWNGFLLSLPSFKQKTFSKAPAFGDKTNTKQSPRESLRCKALSQSGRERGKEKWVKDRVRANAQWYVTALATWHKSHASRTLWVGQMEIPLPDIVGHGEAEEKFICWFSSVSWLTLIRVGSTRIQLSLNLSCQLGPSRSCGQPSSMPPARWQGASCESASGGKSQCLCRSPQRHELDCKATAAPMQWTQ